MNSVSRAKIRCNVKFDDDDDEEEEEEEEEEGACCDYVVALETDNTIEIISSQDGQLVNVRALVAIVVVVVVVLVVVLVVVVVLLLPKSDTTSSPQVISPELCREQLHLSLARATTSSSPASTPF
jgi:hypothetical protein